MDARPRFVALIGATATGKTALGEALASSLGGEVVCADSRQVYSELEAGTGKPDPDERAARPHHLFDALALGQSASAGWYARACREACAGIHARHRVPILVGGSGLYLRAVQEGLAGEPPKDPAVRARIAAELEAFGPEALHARLAALDPGTAARLGPRDRQRIMRALEVVHASGKPLSWWHERQERAPADEHWTVLELVIPAAMLRERIRSRTHAMFEHGLIEETRTLVARGFEPALRALRAIGYDEALELLAGRLTRGDAEAATRRRTTQLAKRQRTWFRHQVQTVRLDGAKGDLESLCEAAAAAAIAGARLEGRGGIDTGSARL